MLQTSQPAQSKTKSGLSAGRWWVALLMVAPFLLVYFAFLIYPSIRVLQLSFTNSDIGGSGKWIGLENYTRLISDPLFWNALVNTLYFIALTVIPNTALGLVMALMVMRLKWARRWVLAAFFLPYVLPVSVVTTRFVAASTTVMLFPASSATQTVPCIGSGWGVTVGAGARSAQPESRAVRVRAGTMKYMGDPGGAR